MLLLCLLRNDDLHLRLSKRNAHRAVQSGAAAANADVPLEVLPAIEKHEQAVLSQEAGNGSTAAQAATNALAGAAFKVLHAPIRC